MEQVRGLSFWEEEQRNERETLFDAEHKKVAASDIELATTWEKIAISPKKA